MERSHWDRVRDLFDRAVELPPAERTAFLERECADDGVRAEVESLLSAAEGAGPLDDLGPRLSSLHEVLREDVPDRVGPYTVAGQIGAGGMAVVYRAHDPRLHRDVALKFLPSFLRDHSPAADQLIAEARAASALDHPNICTIHDIGSTDDDRIFIAMAFYAGGTLQDRLLAGRLPIDDVITIASQVADALDCAHAAGIVHRDVKPANIAFGERGEVKVLDFGVAALNTDAGAPADGSITAGTPSYMSPEQVRGERADLRSDVWSLGVVMFEMLTGRRPFGGASRDALHHSILHDEPPTVTTLRPETPLALASIVARALSRDPAERFQTAAELHWALAEARRAVEGSARARRRLLLGAAAAVLLLVSVGGIAILRPDPDAGPERVAEPLDEQFLRGRDRYFTGTAETNEAAIALFRSIVERDSAHVLARSYLAAAYAMSVRPDYSRRGRTEWLDSAAAHAHIALALAPDHPAPHAALGVVHRWAGRVDSALAHHRRALDLDPAYALSLLETGYLSHVSGRPDDAAILLERGLAIEPDVPAARQYATALYRAFDMQDDAHRHLVAGRTLAPDDASLIWETVMLAIYAGDTTAARGEFDSYIQLIAPGERERMRAWYYMLLGDARAARPHIDRVDLTDAPAYDLRTFGVAYLRTGSVERGRALLERALADIAATSGVADWGYTDSEFHAAYVYAALGDAEASIAALEQWTANGGSRSWRRMDNEWVWRSLEGNRRFRDIVDITAARFAEKRSRVEAELRRRRD